jgi:hypothetical protein
MDPIGEHVHPYSYQSVGGGDESIIEMEVNSTRTLQVLEQLSRTRPTFQIGNAMKNRMDEPLQLSS